MSWSLRSLLLGWLVIVLFVAPLVIGGLVGGDRGASTAALGYVAVALFVMVSLIALIIGDGLRGRLP